MKKILLALSVFTVMAFGGDFENSEKACERDDGYACYELGFWYSTGLGTQKDKVKGFQYYTKSCDLGNNSGCSFLAEAYIHGKGTKKDIDKGLKILKDECNKKNPGDCKAFTKYFLALDSKMKSNYDKLCNEGDANKCHEIAEFFASSFRCFEIKTKRASITEADKMAKKYYSKGCKLGNSESCSNVKWLERIK